MKIEDILKKQGELYTDLTSNKTVQEHNETIEKPKPVKLIPYNGHKILEQEYKAIKELEKMLGIEVVIVDEPENHYKPFEIFIENNKITYLKISHKYFTCVPKQINNLTNLEILYLYHNQITEIKNLDNLTNLRILDLFNNRISEIKNLNNLPNLQKLNIYRNPIKNKEEIKKLRKKGVRVFR